MDRDRNATVSRSDKSVASPNATASQLTRLIRLNTLTPLTPPTPLLLSSRRALHETGEDGEFFLDGFAGQTGKVVVEL